MNNKNIELLCILTGKLVKIILPIIISSFITNNQNNLKVLKRK